MRRAVAVKPLEGYFLYVKFDNGEERVFNCIPLMEDKIYAKISDKEYFKMVHIDEYGVVCWDEGTDINPYKLYEDSESISDSSVVLK